MIYMEKQKYEFWIDKTAKEIVAREKRLKRKIGIFRTESGLGASGFPHIGSFADVVRNYAVALGLKEQKVKSELIAYSDDRDGLRKVPLTLPNWLEKYIGMPVTNIPDPSKCHDSYGEHMSSLLLESLDRAGIEYNFHSATEDYKKGIFNKQIESILLNSEKVGKFVKDLIGQEKFVETLPYFPVCEKCGKMYTTRCYQVVPKEHKVLYICDQEFKGKNLNTGKEIIIKGCGHKGEANYFNGSGKLSWKVEFAMRWSALGIVFEAHGKDIADSVKVNDAISKEILKFEPPMHIVYEMFLDKSGKKVSKSYGNVFTPQVWFNYGNPDSLVLLMLKRFEGTRELDVTDIPKYMDELNKLERIYFGKEEVDGREKVNLKRLFEFINFLKVPKKESLQIPYELMVEILKIAPEKNQIDFVIEKLREYKHLRKVTVSERKYLESRLNLIKNWVEDFVKTEGEKIELNEKEEMLVRNLVSVIEKESDADKIQTKTFEIIKNSGMKVGDGFKTIYRILFNSDTGPKIGPYVIEVGKEEIIKKLKSVL